MPTSPLIRALSVSVVCLLPAFASAAPVAPTVNWMNWTSPNGYPNSNASPSYTYTTSATGSINMPDGSVVNVGLEGEVLSVSCFTLASTDCPPSSWRNWGGWGPSTTFPAGTFTSTNVPDVPPNANLITQAGYTNQKHTLKFDRAVTNIVMNVFSLGRVNQLSAYQFDQPFSMLSQNPNCAPVTRENCLAKKGNTLEGLEGSGSIQFTGTFTEISWTVTVPEYFSGFNIGVTSALVEEVVITASNGASLSGTPPQTIGYTDGGFQGAYATVPTCGAYTDKTYTIPVTSTTPPGTYVTHCADAEATGYRFTYVDGVYTVSPSVVTVTAQNNGSIFGAPPATITYTETGFIAGDTFSTPPVCAAYTDKTYATLVTSATPPGSQYVTHCGGASANNYTINYIDGIYSITSQSVNGQCGTAQGVFTTTTPATVDLCLSGTPSAAVQGADGNFTWTCSGAGGGSSASCSSANGKLNQSLILGPPQTTLKPGRGVVLNLTGGKGTGKVSYSVQSGSGTHCSIRKTSARHVFVKTRGAASGVCTVVASKAGDATYNPATSNTVAINVICPPPVTR